MDAYLAIVSKREVRTYTPEPLSEAQLARILQAGRAVGSSRNRQPWLFVLVTDRARLDALAELVTRPDNLRGCQAAIAIAMESPNQGFDAGRAAQNLMLAAWADGIGTCPNSPRDQAQARSILQLEPERHVQTILSLGHPGQPFRAAAQNPEQLLARIDRKPLDELVRRL